MRHSAPLRLVLLFVAVIGTMSAATASVRHDTLRVAAPFAMPDIYVPDFPHLDFPITAYGAQPLAQGDDSAAFRRCVEVNRAAIAAAMQACHEAGGGRVVVPSGQWPTGPIHFMSGCDLHLAEGSTLVFSDRPEDYLPAVETTWEGYLCYNYSPLLYALRCSDIAITGTGTIAPRMTTWRAWFKRPERHMQALKQLYEWCAQGEAVDRRIMPSLPGSDMRPHLIQFNQCTNVLLEDFKIRQAPFWTIHMFRVKSGVARRLDVKANGHNNDGIDLEMTQDFLVEHCRFDQGDDAVVIKSGSNHDAWRLAMPTRNVVVRHCTVVRGHVLLGIGSEISGGVSNVYMHDCDAPGRVLDLFYLKTNRRRGGELSHIYMERVTAGEMDRAMGIDTDVLYQWRTLVPSYKDTLTSIHDIYMSDVSCHKAKGIVELGGDSLMPLRDIHIARLHVDSVMSFGERLANVVGYVGRDITYDYMGHQDATTGDRQWQPTAK